MNIDHKNISKTYARIFESSSQHTLKHVIELQVDYDSSMYNSIDISMVVDGTRISSTMIDNPKDAISKITKDVDIELREKIGNISDTILTNLLDNLEGKLKEIIKGKSKVEHRTITKVVVSGTYTITNALVGNY